MRSVACGAIVLTAAVLALGFFAAAGFTWVSIRHGLVNACLRFGGFFVLIAAIATVVLVVLKRRVPPPAKTGFAQAIDDPKLLAIGLEIARTLGGRRVGAASLLSAFVVGVLLSRGASKK